MAKQGLLALAACAGAGLAFALRFPGSAVPDQVEDSGDLQPSGELATETAAHCGTASTALDGKLLARMLVRLESRHSDAARCAVLSQLAVRAELGDAPVHVLEKYTRQGYPSRVRLCAVDALGYALSPVAVTSLLELSRTIDPPLREALTHALASREEAAARLGLIVLVRDASSALRIPAALALAELGASEAVTLIAELLEEPGINPKRLITALGESGDPQALGVLQSLLERTDAMFTDEICNALADLGTPASTRLLLSMAEQPRRNVLREASIYRALARSADAAAQQVVLSAADGGNDAALEAITHADTPEVRAWMLRALDTEHSARFQAALAYFSSHADTRAIASLSRLAQGDTTRNARDAVRALGNIGGQAASDALEVIAASDGPAQALALSTFAQQPEAAERARALALSLLDRGDAAPSSTLNVLLTDASPEAHAALLRTARADAAQSRRAIWLLAKRDDPETERVLSEIASTEHAPNRLSALSALAEGGSPQAATVMRAALRSDDPAVREEAVRRFGAFEAPEVEPAMLAASRDTVPEVASAAVAQLGALATAPALDRLAHMASAPADPMAHEALQSLADAAPERAVVVVDSLVQEAGSSGLRAALSAVSSLPSEAGQRVLERALTSTEPGVVSEALTQLETNDTDPSALNLELEQLVHNTQLPSDLREQARNVLLARSLQGDSDP